MEVSKGVTSEKWGSILKELDTEKFLLKLQNYLAMTQNAKVNLPLFKDIQYLDKKLSKLTSEEKRLLKIKINSLITYLDDVNKIHFPSPFIIGVFTAVISLVLGVIIKDPAAFPEWTISMIFICFVLFIPGISWFNLIQSGRDAEVKGILVTIKDILEVQS
ncbi:hypothetical protein MUO14_00280 [Halobacillus shinanisalinarum]|uniref:Uncharacterized protein n=1 Tax=Halobacillus shinanisalinarum TaxID=2932258 RepID=A0ABY4GZM1_9BACI|nr:hypothetical protein [Halobacillus shinanisalinarum]UOQ93481.1 hypothetical protein MUO14_00280 [Halobacillus shinanisalinarum]